MRRVAVLGLPRAVLFDLAIPFQIFGHEDQADRYRVELCSPDGGPLPTTAGTDLLPHGGPELLAVADTVVVPGYEPLDAPPEPVRRQLRAAAERGARLVSICTGAFALAGSGLLDGHRATTHWHHTDELAARFPDVEVVPDVLYVEQGDRATSAGVAAGIDLCLHLLRLDHGVQAANGVARRMVVTPHRDGGQAQFIERPVPPEPGGVNATCEWALAHLDESLTVEHLARHAGQSPRTFARHFRARTGLTPLTWLTEQRVTAACSLLEETDLPIDEIARRTGLGSPANLRLRVGRALATSPTAYRRAFRARS